MTSDDVELRVREIQRQHGEIRSAFFARDLLDDLEQFLEGVRMQGIVDRYESTWMDGTIIVRWWLAGDTEPAVYEGRS